MGSWFDKLYLLFVKKLAQENRGDEVFRSNATFAMDVCFPHAISLIETAHGGMVVNAAHTEEHNLAFFAEHTQTSKGTLMRCLVLLPRVLLPCSLFAVS